MRRKSLLIIVVLALVLGAAFIAWPRRADLRAFEPSGMARLETAMWRDYYERRYGALFYHLYEVSRTQFGFSPLDSLRIALSAARAAKAFQPTRSRAGAAAALPELVAYYALLRPAAPVAFDVETVARLELDWWRETAAARDYGRTIADVAALTYGKSPDNPAIAGSGIARAEAMAYRDARREAMTEQDWGEIEPQLLRAYQFLRSSVAHLWGNEKSPGRGRGFQDFKFGRDQYFATTGLLPRPQLKR
jgi:hypothetical protein